MNKLNINLLIQYSLTAIISLIDFILFFKLCYKFTWKINAKHRTNLLLLFLYLQTGASILTFTLASYSLYSCFNGINLLKFAIIDHLYVNLCFYHSPLKANP